MTVDRGYGKVAFMYLLSDFGLSSFFVMLDHLLMVHPFLAAPFLDPCRGDDQQVALEVEDSNLASSTKTAANAAKGNANTGNESRTVVASSESRNNEEESSSTDQFDSGGSGEAARV